MNDLDVRRAQIRWLVLDVDGIMTDGRITYTDDGRELKTFHVRDGAAIKAWNRLGHGTAILSGRASPAVTRRAAELGIAPVVQGADDKNAAFDTLLAELGVMPDVVAYMGDDEPDVPVLRRVGIAISASDSVPEAKAVAHYVTMTAGGNGAVREAISWLTRGMR